MKSVSMVGWSAKGFGATTGRSGPSTSDGSRRWSRAPGREVGCDDPDMRTALPAAVADALGPRLVSVEQIEDFAEARLGQAGLDDVAPAYVIYRQATSSPRQKLFSGESRTRALFRPMPLLLAQVR